MEQSAVSVGRARMLLATVITVIAAVAYFLMMVASEYRYLGLVFWTVILAAPLLFALGPRQGLLRCLSLGLAWMVSATVLTMMAVLGIMFAAGAVFG